EPEKAAADALARHRETGHDNGDHHRDAQGDRLLCREAGVHPLERGEQHQRSKATTRTTAVPGATATSAGSPATARARRRLTPTGESTRPAMGPVASAVHIVTGALAARAAHAIPAARPAAVSAAAPPPRRSTTSTRPGRWGASSSLTINAPVRAGAAQ